jgi:hypothetical protein
MKKGNSLFKISRAIGKKILVKQDKEGEVIKKFPDMSGITASEGQRNCRNFFKEAVAFARAIINDPGKKKLYQKKAGKTELYLMQRLVSI